MCPNLSKLTERTRRESKGQDPLLKETHDVDRCKINIDRLERGVCKRLDAAELANRQNGSAIVQEMSYLNMKAEALTILQRIADAEQEDDARRARNKNMAFRETTLVILGLLFLLFPGLLLFNELLEVLSSENEYILELVAQEYSLLGSASRVCLKLKHFAQSSSAIHRQSRIYLTICVIILTTILLLLRYTVKRETVRSVKHRETLRLIAFFIGKEIVRRQKKMRKKNANKKQRRAAKKT